MSTVDVDGVLTQSPESCTSLTAFDADRVSKNDARSEAGSPAPTNNSTSAASDDIHEQEQLGDVPEGGHPLPGDEDIEEEYEKLDITDEHFAILQSEHKKQVAGSNLKEILQAVITEDIVKQTALRLPANQCVKKLLRLVWLDKARTSVTAAMARVIGPDVARSERASPNAPNSLHRVQTGKITKKQK